jgi:hypothetical protein
MIEGERDRKRGHYKGSSMYNRGKKGGRGRACMCGGRGIERAGIEGLEQRKRKKEKKI